jgi:peptide/nickel transport system permease protein
MTSPSAALVPSLDPVSDDDSEPTETSAHVGGSRAWRRFRHNKVALLAGAVLVVIALAGLFAPLLTSFDPNLGRRLGDGLKLPGRDYWLGTDQVGRDIYTRLLYGSRYAILSGAQAVAIALVIGIPLGLTMGYFRGWVDRVMMRFVEAVVAIPAIVLALAIVAATGPGLTRAMFAIGVVYSMVIARLARAQVMAAREELYVDAARTIGSSHNRVMWRHILPNVAPALIVQTTLLFATAVLAEAGLSLLGVGARSDQASWGRMLADARISLNQALWPAIPPGLAVFVTVLAFNTLGDGLRDTFSREARGGRLGVDSVRASVRSSEAGPPDPGAVVSARGLWVEFPTPEGSGDVAVVQDVSFDIGAGEVLALVGESGSGKSVAALSLVGLVPDPGRATARSITLGGRELVGLGFEDLRQLRGRDVGFIFQEPSAALNPAFTIGRQIAEPLQEHLRMGRKQARARTLELLGRVGIPNPTERIDDYPHQFSGGMAQRVMIAMALACEPKLLVADEPTTALDVTVQGQVLDLIGDLSSELNLSVLLITHDLGVVADLADRAAVMYAGQVVETGEVAAMFGHPRHPYTEGLLRAIPRNERRLGALPTIPGTVPPPSAWPAGCHFHGRCAHAEPACLEHPIPMVNGGVPARCRRVDELVLIGVRPEARPAEEVGR